MGQVVKNVSFLHLDEKTDFKILIVLVFVFATF